MKFRTPLLVPVAFFLIFIIEGSYHIYNAAAKHDTLKIVTNAIGMAISLAGIIMMVRNIRRAGAKQAIKIN